MRRVVQWTLISSAVVVEIDGVLISLGHSETEYADAYAIMHAHVDCASS